MSSLLNLPRAIIFDLGDVLFSWSAETKTTIPGRQLRQILETPTWHQYERGEITRDACYQLSAEQFSISASVIAQAFAQARASLQPDEAIVSFLSKVKQDGALKLYAMSNIGQEDFDDIESRLDWKLFDRVFTSAGAGKRKPEAGFYEHVLKEIDLPGHRVLFTDDKEENIQAARDFGIQGLVHQGSTIQILRELFEDPVTRGWRYILRNEKQYNSVTNTGVTFADNFAELLIVELLKDPALTDLEWGDKKTWNFFRALVPGGYFPDDLDTTSLALQVLPPSSEEFITSTLNLMAKYANDDGTFQTYVDSDRPRVDPIVGANILACFYTYNRGREFDQTLHLVQAMLLDRSYLRGSRYYPSADCCLWFIGRLLRSSSDDHLQTLLGPLLKSRVRERLGADGGALDIALRVDTCAHLGIACEDDRRALRKLQSEDGGWEAGWMYRYGSTGIEIGNRGVTTAAAVAALASQDMVVEAESPEVLAGVDGKVLIKVS
ncbi:Haloacid dehalogenase-like hydrolase-domain-containing protein [Coniella lustricola]|uniref:Haloacid dehalogenase-like hydrolase-domain-containing protein n=1 Tax=Coniella lustricola TaxID=2025994 RepID=A0A2T3ABU7_9PEZI|nr:Haloacid dehalogenase-like hydrolase-domain-containing protein [Coniella lustricola]